MPAHDYQTPLLSLVDSHGQPDKNAIPLHLVCDSAILDPLPERVRNGMAQSDFLEKWVGKTYIARDENGVVTEIFAGLDPEAAGIETLARVYGVLRSRLGESLTGASVFAIANPGVLTPERLFRAVIGWGLADYRFTAYRSNPVHNPVPRLAIPDTLDGVRVRAYVEGAYLTRDLVNFPANDLGPAELADVAERCAMAHGAEFTVIEDADLLDKNFPLVHTVGMGSPRRPRLIRIGWGDPAHPRIALVGKGVVFDTGGLDLKPSRSMRIMKKDMGGAAHTLGLFWMIARMKLPVRLDVLIPAVENSVSGEAFRPGDIWPSRKGLSVEIENTDAEGRLVLADALCAACEADPELIVDFSTLTGSMRAGLGVDIPGFFSNVPGSLDSLRDIGLETEDPIWPMPLWRPYFETLSSGIADIASQGARLGDPVMAALFLERFLDEESPPHWVHFDMYAWEESGKTWRPKGGADMGLRAVYEWLERKYG